jgi:GT2 family glycosyltransferase
MAAAGVTAVRTYVVPPRWLLDTAAANGLRVMVGLAWEQHVAFLDNRRGARDIVRRVRTAVRSCAGHPALLAFAVGNEIPAPVVRWSGPRRVERFLARVARAVRAEDPGALVTYVNYPSTEYLDARFADFLCFNVYLEERERLDAYLARLHSLAGERPLVMGEVGLDSRRNGEAAQAEALDWQLRAAFGGGCAGVFVFAWTDEWHRGGHEILDWDFGLTDRERCPKPALATVSRAFADVPFAVDADWPRVSVVVCSYNGASTIGETLAGVAALAYPDYELIVVDDGSSDDTGVIAAAHGARVISTENRGLSNARNTGLDAATGKIVAYVDDDAVPDRHWLQYLVASFAEGGYACVGGPNLAPAGDGVVADCVANAPGNPTHILLDDREAEHVPGCNMAFDREALIEVGRFDPAFRVAGDDVDVCWRVQQAGGRIGFSPAAVVWHHRRASVRSYLRQQAGYGRSEALLERRWPERFNAIGHARWTGSVYGTGNVRALRLRRRRVGYGTWGSALFQSVYEPAHGPLGCLPMMPEWYLVLAALAVLGAGGVVWGVLLAALPLLAVGIAISVGCAAAAGAHAVLPPAGGGAIGDAALRGLTAALHLLQPAARLHGRLAFGLAPWRRRRAPAALPWPRTVTVWSELWRAPADWLGSLERELSERGAAVRRGGDFDRYDLQLRGGLLASARVRMLNEEHGGGRQFVRFALRPRVRAAALVAIISSVVLSVAAIVTGPVLAAVPLAAAAFGVIALAVSEAGAAIAALVHVLAPREERPVARLEPAPEQ